MVKIIRKKKKLFEDDTLAAAPVTTQPASAPALPANNTTPAAPVNTAAPTNTATTTPPADNNLQNTLNNQQVSVDNNQQQLNQNLNQQQQLLPTQTLQAVMDVLKNMENTYWCIANNVPEMIKEKIPDFKPDNAEAAPIIKNWDAFKANPSEQSFNAFIDSFKTFGNNTLAQQLQQNVQESLKRKAVADFRSLLESRLALANQDRFTENICKLYF